VKLQPEQDAALLDALDEADHDEGISAEEFFARLLLLADLGSSSSNQILRE